MSNRLFARIAALRAKSGGARYRSLLIAAIGMRVADLHQVPAADPPWKTGDTEALEAILWALRPAATGRDGKAPTGDEPVELPITPREAEHPPAIVDSLVRTSDWLTAAEAAAAAAAKAAAAEGAEVPPTANEAHLLERMRRSLDELMAQCDVSLIQLDGPVRLPEHEVIAVKETADRSLVHHVAETLRPGVRWRGRMIRAQQVVAYVHEDGRRR